MSLPRPFALLVPLVSSGVGMGCRPHTLGLTVESSDSSTPRQVRDEGVETLVLSSKDWGD